MNRKLALLAGVLAVAPTSALAMGWADNFDTYGNATQLHGVGGWTGWDNTLAAGALTSNAFAQSPALSVDISGGSDLVHEYTGVTSGTWRYRASMYLPASIVTGSTYFILMNRYTAGAAGPKAWSAEYEFNCATNMVDDDFAAPATTWGSAPSSPQTIIRDAWTPILVEFDPVANTASNYYNGVLLHGAGRTWREVGNANAVPELQAVDLFANNIGPAYYDNLSLQRVVPVTGFAVTGGLQLGGNLASLGASDDDKLIVLNDETDVDGVVTFDGTVDFAITYLQMNVEISASRTDQTVFYDAKNQTTNAWVNLGSSSVALTDTKVSKSNSSAAAFRNGGTGAIQTRLRFVPFADIETADGWGNSIDMAEMEVR
jgi:hypothetical protein